MINKPNSPLTIISGLTSNAKNIFYQTEEDVIKVFCIKPSLLSKPDDLEITQSSFVEIRKADMDYFSQFIDLSSAESEEEKIDMVVFFIGSIFGDKTNASEPEKGNRLKLLKSIEQEMGKYLESGDDKHVMKMAELMKACGLLKNY